MDTLKTKTAKSNHVVFNFVSILAGPIETKISKKLNFRCID